MKNLIKKSNVKNNSSFSNFSKFQLVKTQLKNIKGGNDGSGNGEGENGIIIEDVVGG